MAKQTIELAYLGFINPQLDHQIKEQFEELLNELELDGEWHYEESSLNSETPYRLIGYNISNILTDWDRIEIIYSVDSMLDGLVKVTRI